MKKGLMLCASTIVAIASLGLSVSASAATYVVPVVVAGVPGLQESFWDSEVRVVAQAPGQALTVRRQWVALSGGGRADDPATAPEWSVQPDNAGYTALLILTGSQLLSGTDASAGAVGLLVDGQAEVYLRVANSRGAPRLLSQNGAPCCFPGNGQTLALSPEPLSGPSHAALVTAASGTFRVNLGIVNPNDSPLHLDLSANVYGSSDLPAGTAWTALVDWPAYGFIDIPALGWLQINGIFEHLLCFQSPQGVTFCGSPEVPYGWHPMPTLLKLRPGGPTPYYAYVSVVYSPANDPEFVPILPGDLEAPTP